MIRNLLYSIFFHIVIIFAIYFGIETIGLDNQSIDKKVELKVYVASNKNLTPQNKHIKSNISKPKPKATKKKTPKRVSDIKKPSPKIKKAPKKTAINKATNIAKNAKNSNDKSLDSPVFDPDKIYLPNNNDKDIDSLLLSAVHKRAIKTQLNFCFTNILKDQDITKNIVKQIEVSFEISKSGVISLDIAKNFDENLLFLDEYDNHRRIIKKIEKKTKKCAIFRNLPGNRYNSWRQFKVLFK